MKILFIGLAYHNKTQSSNFFVEVLRKIGDVTVRSEPMLPKPAEMARIDDAGEFDLVVCWQVYWPTVAIAQMGHENLVWVPMMDSNPTEMNLNSLLDVKTVCFSALLYYQLQKIGFKRALYVRYMPPLSERVVTDFGSVRPFFWQRSSIPSWRSVVQNLAKTQYEKLGVHWAPDEEERLAVPAPTHLDVLRHKIKLTTWFESKEAAEDNLMEYNLYFAPRVSEGIGLSFLDAMSHGFPVAAVDASTMNEYIVHGRNGLLMDAAEAARPINIAPRQLELMSKNTIETVERGHEQWLNDLEKVEETLC